MIAFALLIGVIVLLVVPPTVWWAVTQVVPRVLAEQGLPAGGARAEQEARLRRMEEAIDAIALKVDEIARQQALTGPERGPVSMKREELP